MHIILVFTYGISLKNWDESGILHREMKLYKTMNKQYSINYTFVTFGDEEDEEYCDLIEGLTIIPIYKHQKKSKYKIIDLIRTISITKNIVKTIKDPTHIKTNQLNGAWVAMMIKLYSKLPLYVRTGYNLFEFAIREKKSFMKKIFYYMLTQIALIYSNNYSVTSLSDKKFLEKYFITKKIEVIPNWVTDTKENSFENRHKNKIISVGRLEFQKNYESLVKSLSGTNIQIDIVGEGTEKSSLETLSINTKTNLNFLGRVGHSELNELYLNYRIFVLSSNFEGNPKVVLEAMSRGVLVIARRNKNIEEIIENNHDGIIFDNSNEILNLVESFLDNKAEWERIVLNGYKKVKNNNLIDGIASKEKEIYS